MSYYEIAPSEMSAKTPAPIKAAYSMFFGNLIVTPFYELVKHEYSYFVRFHWCIDLGGKRKPPTVASLAVFSRFVYQNALQVKDDG